MMQDSLIQRYDEVFLANTRKEAASLVNTPRTFGNRMLAHMKELGLSGYIADYYKFAKFVRYEPLADIEEFDVEGNYEDSTTNPIGSPPARG